MTKLRRGCPPRARFLTFPTATQVARLAAEVRDIVDRGQADIGLDYAYLDDVTYLDWQRYHDLERSKSDTPFSNLNANLIEPRP